jgi:adenylate kinase
MGGSTIIVFGLSGVGKTTACRVFVEHHPEYLYFQASELLRDVTNATNEQLRTADASRIIHNQRLIGAALRTRRSGRERQPVIIDAHSVIDNDQGLIRIPIDAIKQLCPTGLIFLEADPDTLYARRSRASKPRPIRSVNELAQQQEVAKETVNSYARNLGVPMVISFVTDGFDLASSIQSLFRKPLHH